MKYCVKCKRLFDDRFSKCESCKAALDDKIKSDDIVFLITAGGFERDRISAALKDSNIPFITKLEKAAVSPVILTGQTPSNEIFYVPFELYERAKDVLIGIGAEKADIAEEFINNDTEVAMNSEDEADNQEDEPKMSPAKSAFVKTIAVFLVLLLVALAVWGTDYLMGLIKGII